MLGSESGQVERGDYAKKRWNVMYKNSVCTPQVEDQGALEQTAPPSPESLFVRRANSEALLQTY